MRLELDVTTGVEYFNQTEREIDFDDCDDNKVSFDQYKLICRILATEVSIYLMRRSSNLCGSIIDTMVDMRNLLIIKYNEKYEPYVEYNDYY